MKYIYNDGKHGPDPRVLSCHTSTKDCVVRAIAIATQIPYDEVARRINYLADEEFFDGSDAKHGVHKQLWKTFLTSLGWTWTPTMGIGTGCTVHLRDGELPMGRLIVSVSRHLVAVIDGVINDRYDCSRNGTRCVYGYFRLTSEAA
jgi:hypothetical protein